MLQNRLNRTLSALNRWYLARKSTTLAFWKAHDGLPDPDVVTTRHDFQDRPPHGHPARPSALGMLRHTSCPSLRARSEVSALTVKMPYVCGCATAALRIPASGTGVLKTSS